MAKRSHKELITWHLKRHGSIGFFEALELYRCKRPEARIHELRRDGLNIETKMETSRSGARYARYFLKSKPRQAEMF